MNQNNNETAVLPDIWFGAAGMDNKYQEAIEVLAARHVKQYSNVDNRVDECSVLKGLKELINIRDTTNSRHTMFMNVPAGGGKSRLLQSLIVCSQLLVENVEREWSSHEVKVEGATGVAATEISGKTKHRLLAIVQNAKVSNDYDERDSTCYYAID